MIKIKDWIVDIMNRQSLLFLPIGRMGIGVISLIMISLISCGTEVAVEPDGEGNPLKETVQPVVETNTETPAKDLSSFTLTVDATNQENWAYFSFKEGKVIEMQKADSSKEWDLAFQRTKVKINGGISGPGDGGVVMLTETQFSSVVQAPADGYEIDTADTLAIVPQSKKGWYVYTGVPTHWVLPIEDRIFVFTTATGAFAKVQFLGYYKDNKANKDPAFVTFKFMFQNDGSRNF